MYIETKRIFLDTKSDCYFEPAPIFYFNYYTISPSKWQNYNKFCFHVGYKNRMIAFEFNWGFIKEELT